MTKALASLIRELRRTYDLRQEDLASVCGVSRSCVSMWEVGNTIPSRRYLDLLSERFPEYKDRVWISTRRLPPKLDSATVARLYRALEQGKRPST